MPLKVKTKRDGRYTLPVDLGASIEFDVPGRGHYRFQLLNISGLGLAFFIPGPIPGIEPGIMLPDVQIQVDSVVIRGDLVVQHTLPDHPSNYKCGAQFFPASDTDRNELASLLSRLDLLSRPPFGTERQVAD